MHRLVVALTTASLAALYVPARAATEPGDEWQVTTEMQMGGMSMPRNSSRVCAPRESADPPGAMPQDGDCEMYDVERRGNTMKWKMRCTGASKTTGTGEMTWQGKDGYQGTMTMNTDEGPMTMKVSGKRTGAACDAGALKRQAAAAQAQSAEFMAEQCQEGVKGMMVMYFDGSMPLNCDPKYKADFCKRLGTEQGYDLVAMRNSTPTGRPDLAAAGNLCGMDPEPMRKQLCDTALKGESSLLFAGRHCPGEAAPLAQRECAGRSFTSPPAAKYQEFCTAYARHGALGGAAEQPPAEVPRPDSPVEKGKKALKKLIPF